MSLSFIDSSSETFVVYLRVVSLSIVFDARVLWLICITFHSWEDERGEIGWGGRLPLSKWKVRDTRVSSIPCVTPTLPTSTTSAHHLHPHHLYHKELLMQPQQQHHYHPTVSWRVLLFLLQGRRGVILFRRRLFARGRRWWLWWHPVNECCCLQGWWRSSHLPQHPLSRLPLGGKVPASFLLHFYLWWLTYFSSLTPWLSSELMGTNIHIAITENGILTKRLVC